MGTVTYSHPPLLVAALARDALLGRKRSFHRDALEFVRQLKPPLCVLGQENIPQRAPCIVTANHYFRPGFHAWWIALGIAASVPVEMYWTMTGELTFPGRWYSPFAARLSRFVLKRIARMYKFTTMPPMPPRRKDVEARARAVREVLAVMQTKRPILGLAPEGGDAPDGRLSMPAPGLGRFALLLANLNVEIVPVGVYEADEDGFCIHFGEAYQLNVPDGLSPREKDRMVAKMIMEKISLLLPTRLRGELI